MELEGAIRRFAFAEARSSAQEAMLDIARRRSEIAVDRAMRPVNDDAEAMRLTDAARQRKVDRTA